MQAFDGDNPGVGLGSFVVNLDSVNQNVFLSNFATVPEPGASLLLVAGLGLLTARRRARR